MKEIKARVRLENGRLISAKNAARIVVYALHLCENHIHRQINPKTYRETWVVRKEKEGWIFREITHGAGMCGHHKTLRRMVGATAVFVGSAWHFRYKLCVEDAPVRFTPGVSWDAAAESGVAA